MHAEAYAWCQRWGSTVHGHALDVGGRNVNGTARDLWPNMEWTVLDIAGDPGNTADRVIQADAVTWTPDRQYDLVLSTELLEHEPQWRECVQTMIRALHPHGLMIITCAGLAREPHSGIDGGSLRNGEKYEGIHPWDLANELEELFSIVTPFNGSDEPSVDVYAAAWFSLSLSGPSWGRFS